MDEVLMSLNSLTAVSLGRFSIYIPTPMHGALAIGTILGSVWLWQKYQKASEHAFQNRNFTANTFKTSHLTLQQTPSFACNYDALLSAIIDNPFAIRYASASLRQDPRFHDLALASIACYAKMRSGDSHSFVQSLLNSITLWKHGCILQYIPELCDDFEIVQTAIASNPNEIQYAGPQVRAHHLFRELVLHTVRRDPEILSFVPEFHHDYEIVGTAVAANPSLLHYANQELRQNKRLFDHLTYIAFQRQAYVIPGTDELSNEPISYHEALDLLEMPPGATLPEEMARWAKAKGVLLERYAGLLSLEGEAAESLTLFLQRLHTLPDYRRKSRQEVIERVDAMLHLASKNALFKNDMLALVQESLESCRDRVLIIFDDIEVLSQFYPEKELSESEFRALAIRAQRYEELKTFAKEICPSNGDLIEMILYLRIHLKKALHLPISTKTMAYPDRAEVTPKMLLEADQKISSFPDEELLAHSSRWQQRIARLRADKAEEVKNHYGALMMDLNEYFECEDREAYLKEHMELQEFLKKAAMPEEYVSLSKFLSTERERALSRL